MSTCAEFVSRVLQSRDRAHMAHWATKSYSEHIALGKFYADILELIDGFVEQYQGAYSRRLKLSMPAIIPADIRTHLSEQSYWIEQHRYEVCDKDDTALQNTIDEILRAYQSVLYLLTLE